jgi:hypothetical protein
MMLSAEVPLPAVAAEDAVVDVDVETLRPANINIIAKKHLARWLYVPAAILKHDPIRFIMMS